MALKVLCLWWSDNLAGAEDPQALWVCGSTWDNDTTKDNDVISPAVDEHVVASRNNMGTENGNVGQAAIQDLEAKFGQLSDQHSTRPTKFGDDRIIFLIDKAMQHSHSNDDTCFRMDVIDEVTEEELDALLNDSEPFLIVISALLKDDEKKRLVSILKNHKEAFAWKTSEGISPSLCNTKSTLRTMTSHSKTTST
ncbi:hypothetical protein Tco_1027893 [Tanacetum coccineum]